MSRHQLLLVWFPKEFRTTYETDIVEILSRDTTVGRRLFDALDMLWGAIRMQLRVTVRRGETRLWRVQRFSAIAAVVFVTTLVVAAPIAMPETSPVPFHHSPTTSSQNRCVTYDAPGYSGLHCYR